MELENKGSLPGTIVMSDASQDNQLVIGRQDVSSPFLVFICDIVYINGVLMLSLNSSWT